MVVKADRLPAPGETILGGEFMMAPGGKGANQAVAAARLGGEVCLIAKVGDDMFGLRSVELFSREGIDTSSMVVDPEKPSGVALITVDANGENCIVVASGANARLRPGDLERAGEKIKQAALIVMQLEIPLPTVEWVVTLAAQHKVRVILNPAPACALPDGLLGSLFLITPNQTEAEMLTGVVVSDIAGAEKAARVLATRGVRNVVITMGAQGAVLLEGDRFEEIAAPVVKAVDTTAAGDVFCGALAVAIAEGLSMTKAVAFGCRAAAISVTRMGAQPSAPRREEVERQFGRE